MKPCWLLGDNMEAEHHTYCFILWIIKLLHFYQINPREKLNSGVLLFILFIVYMTSLWYIYIYITYVCVYVYVCLSLKRKNNEQMINTGRDQETIPFSTLSRQSHFWQSPWYRNRNYCNCTKEVTHLWYLISNSYIPSASFKNMSIWKKVAQSLKYGMLGEVPVKQHCLLP